MSSMRGREGEGGGNKHYFALLMRKNSIFLRSQPTQGRVDERTSRSREKGGGVLIGNFVKKCAQNCLLVSELP